jgi:hypothetical protein
MFQPEFSGEFLQMISFRDEQSGQVNPVPKGGKTPKENNETPMFI